jgi:hypothetical protein
MIFLPQHDYPVGVIPDECGECATNSGCRAKCTPSGKSLCVQGADADRRCAPAASACADNRGCQRPRTGTAASAGRLSATSLAVYRQEVRPFTDTPVALLKNFSVLISWAHKRKSLVEIGESSRTTRFASERGEFSPNGSQFGYVPCVRSACIRSAACAACRRYRRRSDRSGT